ncbi:MAG: biotin/lipoyl-binding protein [Bacteroidetes bacterium]|nr:biotin/lipoyl-binding protein [Bacteroidota bacterium]
MNKVTVADKSFNVESENGSFSIDNKAFNADVLEFREGKFHILQDNRSYTAEIISFDKDEKSFEIKVNSNIYIVKVQDRFDQLLKQMGIDATAGKKVNDIKAPMPGMVLQVMVESGQQIKKGDAIVVLEAMKMENILKSPSDGVVKTVKVIKGDKVEKNQVMVFLD